MSLGYRKGLISSAVDGAAITAAAATTCLPAAARAILPANFFDAEGQGLFAHLHGRISCAVTTPGTVRWDIRLGGTVVFDTLAIPLNIVAKTSVPFELEVMMTVRLRGAAGNFMGYGKFTSEALVGSPAAGVGGVGVQTLPYNTAPVVGGNVDLTASQQLDCFFTQTVATGSMTVHQAVFEAFRWE